MVSKIIRPNDVELPVSYAPGELAAPVTIILLTPGGGSSVVAVGGFTKHEALTFDLAARFMADLGPAGAVAAASRIATAMLAAYAAAGDKEEPDAS